jgi:hypothetical protein
MLLHCTATKDALTPAGTMSSPDAAHQSANELPVPQEPRRRVSISADPPTIADERPSPYSGQETRRRLSVASSDHLTSDGRRKSILVQHTPDSLSEHSLHSGNTNYVNYGFQNDGRLTQCDAASLGEFLACCSTSVLWFTVLWTAEDKDTTLRSFGTRGNTHPTTQGHITYGFICQVNVDSESDVVFRAVSAPGLVGGYRRFHRIYPPQISSLI